MELPPVLESVKRYPSAHLRSVSFDVAAAFVSGYDAAVGGGLLVGFREWLIVEIDGGNNLAWSELVKRALLRRGMVSGRGDEEKQWVEGLFVLLGEMLQARDGGRGLREIYLRYEEWLRRQAWYVPSSPDWIAPRSG